MAFSRPKFKISEWGPKKLRDILKAIQDEVNERTPLEGIGTELSQQPDGIRITFKKPSGTGAADAEGSGGSGSTVNLYGANNGAPALFHLLQSSPPTAL